MCFLSSGFARVNKEIKSLTCEKLGISVPPCSAERQQEEEEKKEEKKEEEEKEEDDEEEEEGALLGPAAGVPTGRSPPSPVSSGRRLVSHPCYLPPSPNPLE